MLDSVVVTMLVFAALVMAGFEVFCFWEGGYGIVVGILFLIALAPLTAMMVHDLGNGLMSEKKLRKLEAKMERRQR